MMRTVALVRWGFVPGLCLGLLVSCGGQPVTNPAPPAIGPAPVPEVAPPPRTEKKTPQAGGTTIVVRAGQSLGRIAEEYGVSIKAIIDANSLSPPYKLKTGARLVIPGAGRVGMAQAEKASPTPTPRPAASPARVRRPPAAAKTEPEVIPLDEPRPGRVIPLD